MAWTWALTVSFDLQFKLIVLGFRSSEAAGSLNYQSKINLALKICPCIPTAAHGYSLRLVYVRIYNWSPSTILPRVSESLGIGWRGDQSVWQAAEKEQSEGPAAASQPLLWRRCSQAISTSISWDWELLHPFVSGNTKSLLLLTSTDLKVHHCNCNMILTLEHNHWLVFDYNVTLWNDWSMSGERLWHSQ